MKVYVLQIGERCEGSSIINIYTSEKAAIKAAHNWMKKQEYTQEWKHNWPINEWTCYCDILRVTTWDVSKVP